MANQTSGLPMTERHVQAIWYDRELRPVKLFAESGELVRVVHPGEWNQSSGPDFRGAVLEVGAERRRIVGDVEVHLTPTDWDAHGHGSDAAYRNVIAHVTWRNGAPPATLPTGALTICLGRFLASEIGFSPESIDVGAYPFGRQPTGERPCREQADRSPERARQILARAGRWRLKAKAKRIGGELTGVDDRQVFYSEVMKALGYGKNGNGFRAIASAVPYSVVANEPENVASAFLTAATFVDWNRDHVRPNNTPEVRLEAAARLFAATGVMTLAEANDVSQASCRRMVAVMTEGGHVGRGRAAAIVANVVIPFALARGAVRDVPDWLPPEDLCEPARRVAYRFFGRDHNPKALYAANGLCIQGLIQIGREWCARLHPECVGCEVTAPLPT